MGYIPGFSQAAFGTGLQRDTGIAQRDLARKEKELKKYQSKRSLLGNILGKGAGLAAGALLTPVLGPGGVMAGKAIASTLGSALGSSKMLSGSGPEIGMGSTGLGTRSYEDLIKSKSGLDKQMQGQALGAGAAQIKAGLAGVAGDQLKSSLGKGLMSKTGINLRPPTDASLFGESMPVADIAGADDYFQSTGNPLTQFQKGGYAFQKGGYVPSYQSGGEVLGPQSLEDTLQSQVMGDDVFETASKQGSAPLGMLESPKYKEMMQAFRTADFNKERIMGKAAERADLRGSREMDEVNMQGLLGLTGQSKDILSSMQDYSKGQDFFRQQDPSNTPFGQQLEPMMNPFTGEPLGELSATELPRGLQKLIPEGTYQGDEFFSSIPKEGIQQYLQGAGDESAMSMFPEQYQDRQDEPKSNLLQRLFGRQMGGMMGVSKPLPYNMGGTVQQQPMAYQLGGLLKYNRSPGR